MSSFSYINMLSRKHIYTNMIMSPIRNPREDKVPWPMLTIFYYHEEDIDSAKEAGLLKDNMKKVMDSLGFTNIWRY